MCMMMSVLYISDIVPSYLVGVVHHHRIYNILSLDSHMSGLKETGLCLVVLLTSPAIQMYINISFYFDSFNNVT